jgi:type IV secretory pathway VirD2 relaxase
MFREVKEQDLFWDGNPETLSDEQLATLKKYLERLAFNGDQEAIEREEQEIRAEVEQETHLSRSGVRRI